MANRIYHHYRDWEDYQNGLYALPSVQFNEPHLITEAIGILSDQIVFYEIAMRVITEWKNSAEVNLTNPSRNKQAWIGQSSCCMACGVPAYLTKEAWHALTKTQQDQANATADKVIDYWEHQCRNVE